MPGGGPNLSLEPSFTTSATAPFPLFFCTTSTADNLRMIWSSQSSLVSWNFISCWVKFSYLYSNSCIHPISWSWLLALSCIHCQTRCWLVLSDPICLDIPFTPAVNANNRVGQRRWRTAVSHLPTWRPPKQANKTRPGLVFYNRHIITRACT